MYICTHMHTRSGATLEYVYQVNPRLFLWIGGCSTTANPFTIHCPQFDCAKLNAYTPSLSTIDI